MINVNKIVFVVEIEWGGEARSSQFPKLRTHHVLVMFIKEDDRLRHIPGLLLLIKQCVQSVHLHPQIPVVD